MHFEKALNNFIAEIKQCYRHEPKIKSMELSEDLYRRIELELWENTSRSQLEKLVGQRCIRFYSHGDMISLHKETKSQPEKPKRTIAEVILNAHGMLIVKSNDGKLYLMIHGFNPNVAPQWFPYSDLPQD